MKRITLGLAMLVVLAATAVSFMGQSTQMARQPECYSGVSDCSKYAFIDINCAAESTVGCFN